MCSNLLTGISIFIGTIESNICKKMSNFLHAITIPMRSFGISIKSTKTNETFERDNQLVNQQQTKCFVFFSFHLLHTFLLFMSLFLPLSRIPWREYSFISNRANRAFQLLLHFMSLDIACCLFVFVIVKLLLLLKRSC